MSKIKIAHKIVDYRIDQAKEEQAKAAAVEEVATPAVERQASVANKVVRMHEKLDRP